MVHKQKCISWPRQLPQCQPRKVSSTQKQIILSSLYACIQWSGLFLRSFSSILVEIVLFRATKQQKDIGRRYEVIVFDAYVCHTAQEDALGESLTVYFYSTRRGSSSSGSIGSSVLCLGRWRLQLYYWRYNRLPGYQLPGTGSSYTPSSHLRKTSDKKHQAWILGFFKKHWALRCLQLQCSMLRSTIQGLKRWKS